MEPTSRADVRLARQRILAIFLLIRYTGAKLSEVLNLDPLQAIDAKGVERLTIDGHRNATVITNESCQRLGLKKGDPVWVVFNSFAVVLPAE